MTHDAQVRDANGNILYQGSREHAESYALSASQDGGEYDVFHRDQRTKAWFHRRTFINGEAE